MNLKELQKKYAGELDFRFTHERKKEILSQAIEETARVAFEAGKMIGIFAHDKPEKIIEEQNKFFGEDKE